MLNIFHRAIRFNSQKKKTYEELFALVDEAQDFAEAFNESGICDHPRVPMSEGIMQVLINCACHAGAEEKTFDLLNQLEIRYGIQPTSLSYEPIIRYYSRTKGDLTEVNSLLTTMVNKGITLSTQIVDCAIRGYLYHGAEGCALDKAQDIFNQHRIRLLASTALALLDASLKKNDVFEARRVVVVVSQMFTPEERAAGRQLPLRNIESIAEVESHSLFLLSEPNLIERFKTYNLSLY